MERLFTPLYMFVGDRYVHELIEGEALEDPALTREVVCLL